VLFFSIQKYNGFQVKENYFVSSACENVSFTPFLYQKSADLSKCMIIAGCGWLSDIHLGKFQSGF
jgi:uncharacterized membrane protein YjjB (DUF3815 family)